MHSKGGFAMIRNRWYVSFGVWVLCCTVAIAQPAQSPSDSQYSEQERRAAWKFAVDMAPAASQEQVLRIYQQALSILDQSKASSSSFLNEDISRSLLEECCSQDGVPQVRAEFENEDMIDKIRADETWQRNFEALSGAGEIVGVSAEEPRHPEVVMVNAVHCMCTGTLIRPDVVVTARHCLYDCRVRISPPLIEIKEIIIGPTSQSSTRFKVARVVQHDDPNVDLALLFLETPVPSDVATPAKIATSQELRDARGAVIMGYGYNNEGRSGTKMRGLTAFYDKDCRSGGCRALEIMAYGSSSDTCYGDSGGPLFISVDGELKLIGATSRAISPRTRPFGGRNVACGFGGIYVNVRAYYDSFIKPNIDEFSDASEIDPSEETNDAEPVSLAVEEALKTLKESLDDFEKALKE